MKTNSPFLTSLIILFIAAIPFSNYAQFSAGAPANFGIDGDLKNDYRMSGSFTAAGTHDWFKLSAGTGIGIIDTTNTGGYITSLAAGNNIAFNQGMSIPRYSTVNGKLLLDARYARDQFGQGTAAGTIDYTSFTGSKNGQDPTAWSTVPTGAPVGDKYDIIDAFMHLRRDGTVISGASPSSLIANVAISTVGTTGTRYFDAELFCSKISYNSSTGKFSNGGPAATGGHTAWTFNANGTIKQFGDVTISFAFASSSCSEIYIMVWVSQADYLSINPATFDFVSSEYYGTSGGYGYAKIKPNSGNAVAWGVGNTAVGATPPWGTNSKTLGNNSLNGFATNYDAGQLGEAAIDLTALGVDPAFYGGMSACNPPFSRILFKSRASASFTSNLEDFAGPYQFLDAPDATIATPGVLKCNAPSITLSALYIESGISYQWTTSGGSILSGSTSSAITVDKPGKYYLSTGCSTKIDSVTVSADYNKPIATASSTGILITSVPSLTVTLNAGDSAASNYMTPFGRSAGLAWSWTGPNGFTSNRKDTSTNQTGNYQLVLTELRNGCKDTANIALLSYSLLPVKFISFDGVASGNKTVLLNWITDFELDDSHYELERSFDSKNFTTIATELPGASFATRKSYEYTDKSQELMSASVVYYRLRQVYLTNKSTYSKVLAVKFTPDAGNIMQISPNPFAERLTVRFNSTENASAEIRVINVSGQVVLSKPFSVAKGYNNIPVEGLAGLTAGFYVAQLISNGVVVEQEKVIKK